MTYTKEQVQALWDAEAQAVIKAKNITGGTIAGGWTQEICGIINLRAVSKLLGVDLHKVAPETLAAASRCCTIGANASQQGQRLFSEKKQRSTKLETELVSLVTTK